jgi:tetratricopeptide (TPR) repeat protein
MMGPSMSLEDALAALRSGDAAARRQALAEVEVAGDMRVTPAVAACLHDDDEEVVSAAEAALWQIWGRAPDPASAERFAAGLERLQAQDWLGAVTAFTGVVEQAPGFAEGWNKRATARYLAEHYAMAIEDCEAVVRLNPYHFGALSGQGLCHVALGQAAQAAACFRRALRIHPRLPGVRARLQEIELERVRGNGH